MDNKRRLNMERIHELMELFRKLNNNEIRPSKIVGTGLKNSRELAYSYIYSRLTDEIAKLND